MNKCSGSTKMLVNRTKQNKTCVSGFDFLFSFTIFYEDYTEKVRIDQIKVKRGKNFPEFVLNKSLICIFFFLIFKICDRWNKKKTLNFPFFSDNRHYKGLAFRHMLARPKINLSLCHFTTKCLKPCLSWVPKMANLMTATVNFFQLREVL